MPTKTSTTLLTEIRDLIIKLKPYASINNNNEANELYSSLRSIIDEFGRSVVEMLNNSGKNVSRYDIHKLNNGNLAKSSNFTLPKILWQSLNGKMSDCYLCVVFLFPRRDLPHDRIDSRYFCVSLNLSRKKHSDRDLKLAADHYLNLLSKNDKSDLRIGVCGNNFQGGYGDYSLANIHAFEYSWSRIPSDKELANDLISLFKDYCYLKEHIEDSDATAFLNEPPIPVNTIWFGAPGTGKSYKLNELLQAYFPDRYERVTFYADYLHSQFVGSYKPVMGSGKDDKDNDRRIEYQFRPGPFTRVLVRALNDPSNNYALVIEELNRAEAASVFGDVFQLLDRDGNGRSEYAITVSEDLREYLNATDEKDKNHLSGNGLETLESLTEQSDCSQIVIPKNMYILATMNSADQGVFPLDTAFKRRWDFEYVGIDDGDNAKDENGEYIIKDRDWVTDYRKTINRNLLAAGIPEDKQMGPFFLGKPSLSFGEEDFDKAMRNKVIMYLFEDAAKYNFADVFNTDAIRNTLGASEEVKHFSLSELFTAWDNINYGMFQGLQSKPRVQAAENKNSTPVSDSDKSLEDNQEPVSADQPEQESGE